MALICKRFVQLSTITFGWGLTLSKSQIYPSPRSSDQIFYGKFQLRTEFFYSNLLYSLHFCNNFRILTNEYVCQILLPKVSTTKTGYLAYDWFTQWHPLLLTGYKCNMLGYLSYNKYYCKERDWNDLCNIQRLRPDNDRWEFVAHISCISKDT